MKGRTRHWVSMEGGGQHHSRDSPESSLPPTIHSFNKDSYRGGSRGPGLPRLLPVGLRARGRWGRKRIKS